MEAKRLNNLKSYKYSSHLNVKNVKLLLPISKYFQPYYFGWQIMLERVILKITDCEHVFWIIHIIIQMGIMPARIDIVNGKE